LVRIGSVRFGLEWFGFGLAWMACSADRRAQTTSAAHVKMERIKTREIAIVL